MPTAAPDTRAHFQPPRRTERRGRCVPDAAGLSEQRLFEEYARSGNPAVKERLVSRFLPLAYSLAARFTGSDARDDLKQVACLGLLKALERFDPDRGKSFPAYAVPTILGELKRHLRDTGWAVHVSRRVQELALTIHRTTEALTCELGRTPVPREVADALELTVEEVLEALEASRHRQTDSLDWCSEESGEEGPALQERIGGDDPLYELIDDGLSIVPVLESLPEAERSAIGLRFFEDLTQREIGAQMGISQMQVSRLISRGLEKARANALAEG